MSKKEKDLLYIAGGLFSEAEVRQRKYEKKALVEKLGESIEVFSPLEDNPSNDKSTNPTAEDIFNGDTDKIIDSKYIFAELDGEDVGVYAELGIVYGLNLMLKNVEKALDLTNNPEDLGIKFLQEIIEKIPEKKVVAHLSDIRIPNAGEYTGFHVPVGYNQYGIGMLEQLGQIYHSTEEAINAVVNLGEYEGEKNYEK